MLKINLIAVGTLKERYWTEAVAEYAKRISRFASLSILEIAEKRTINEEGKEIIKKISGYPIAFDLNGAETDSVGFADTIQKLLNGGKSEISFIIGGSEGLSEEVKSKCAMRLSFGKVTYPHQLMRVIASEQIYRALTIMNNVKYHK